MGKIISHNDGFSTTKSVEWIELVMRVTAALWKKAEKQKTWKAENLKTEASLPLILSKADSCVREERVGWVFATFSNLHLSGEHYNRTLHQFHHFTCWGAGDRQLLLSIYSWNLDKSVTHSVFFLGLIVPSVFSRNCAAVVVPMTTSIIQDPLLLYSK